MTYQNNQARKPVPVYSELELQRFNVQTRRATVTELCAEGGFPAPGVFYLALSNGDRRPTALVEVRS